ncbi:ester cyclase [Desulfobacterales bacterium]|nr:ester cyclase [Desulfobacterales bacterium]
MKTMHSYASQLFDAHMQAELAADLEATMETMVANPHLINLGSGSGGVGKESVRKFYAEQLIGQFFPPDAEFVPISRTIDGERLVDEVVIKFTHTQKIEHLLPNVEPTGRKVTMAVVVIVGLQGDKVSYEHIYWDQAGLLVQLGLLNPKGLPIDPTAPKRLLAAMGH